MGNASDEAGARGYLMITFSRAAGGIAGELQLRDRGYLSGKKRPDPAAAFAETLGQAVRIWMTSSPSGLALFSHCRRKAA